MEEGADGGDVCVLVLMCASADAGFAAPRGTQAAAPIRSDHPGRRVCTLLDPSQTSVCSSAVLCGISRCGRSAGQGLAVCAERATRQTQTRRESVQRTRLSLGDFFQPLCPPPPPPPPFLADSRPPSPVSPQLHPVRTQAQSHDRLVAPMLSSDAVLCPLSSLQPSVCAQRRVMNQQNACSQRGFR